MRLHHVQVACPAGGEDVARRFWADGLGLTEVEKPDDLRVRGGAWFRAYDASGRTAAELHVGVEEPPLPGRKAHPALLVERRRRRGGPAARGSASRWTTASATASRVTCAATASTGTATGSSCSNRRSPGRDGAAYAGLAGY